MVKYRVSRINKNIWHIISYRYVYEVYQITLCNVVGNYGIPGSYDFTE